MSEQTADSLIGQVDENGRVEIDGEFCGRVDNPASTQQFEVTDLPAYAFQHHIDSTWGERGRLYAGIGTPGQAFVGIDWDVGPVTDAGAYAAHENDRAEGEWNRLKSISETGAVVRAYYGPKANGRGDHPHSQLDDYVKIGVVPPGVSIRAVPVEIGSARGENPQQLERDELFLTGVPLFGTVEVSRNEAPSDLFDSARHSVWSADGSGVIPDVRDVYRRHR